MLQKFSKDHIYTFSSSHTIWAKFCVTWGHKTFLPVIVGSLLYNINHLQTTVGVIWHYINKTVLNWKITEFRSNCLLVELLEKHVWKNVLQAGFSNLEKFPQVVACILLAIQRLFVTAVKHVAFNTNTTVKQATEKAPKVWLATPTQSQSNG